MAISANGEWLPTVGAGAKSCRMPPDLALIGAQNFRVSVAASAYPLHPFHIWGDDVAVFTGVSAGAVTGGRGAS